MQDFGLNDLAWIVGSLFCVSVIGILWTQRAAIVSIVSGISARARAEGEARRAYRQRVYDHEQMSSEKVSRALFPINGNSGSPALDRTSELSGSAGAFLSPTIAELLEQLSDDELLTELAQVRDANGNPKYADSRIAKFIGGRTEDRVTQVRDVRGKAPPPPRPAPQLRVRADGIERLIDKYGSRRPA